MGITIKNNVELNFYKRELKNFILERYKQKKNTYDLFIEYSNIDNLEPVKKPLLIESKKDRLQEFFLLVDLYFYKGTKKTNLTMYCYFIIYYFNQEQINLFAKINNITLKELRKKRESIIQLKYYNSIFNDKILELKKDNPPLFYRIKK